MTTNPYALNVYNNLLAACISETMVADIQERARLAGIYSVHAIMNGFGSGLGVNDFTVVDYMVPLTKVLDFPDSNSAKLACIADAVYAVEDEMRRRNMVHFDPTRVEVLSTGIAFGVNADPSIVASAFAWATHAISSIVSWQVADAVEDAWGGIFMDDGVSLFNWLARWADTPNREGQRPRFWSDEEIVMNAVAALRQHKAARA